ncbi:alpha-1-antitrypsin homolog isoform X2 [Hypomesus transpacificus]|uniref:alpha-1-antitrypsin homolog isoform X2 n=1 Tax=Hypomesus transpacificus TaxID=137520 RepID=UPI001F0852D3|nr:alpha-1-antitrypsin homolog isoform X2 [Hypomesus transpacificus]
MWGKAICGVIAAVLLSVACAAPHEGDHGGHSEDHHHHHLHHGPNEPHHSHGQGEDACHKLSPHNADFAMALYRSLSARPDVKNVFFSPLGIANALSMLSLGAKGETHSQIFSTLGYSKLTPEQVNEAYEHLLHMLSHAKDTMLLDMGNALAMRDGFKTQERFLNDAKHFYSSEAFNVDFKKTEQAAAQINKFIAQKTQDKITDMVQGLDPDTAMVLINYVLFRGKWEKPFEAKLTEKASFQVDENTKVEVDMMKRTGRFDFFQDPDNFTSVIMLPYKGNTSMMVILPDQGKMKTVESYLNKDYIKHWHDSMFRSSVDLFMPKISISASSSLGDILKNMGMVNAFADRADFSGISVETQLKVSKISHKAVLTVDETGTDAAAGTTIEIMPMSLPDTMNLNRPFLVLIVEDSTKSILFMGKISDPTAK